MIKDLMASAGNNKATNLAGKTLAKGVNAEEGQQKGLFGMLFQSMQAEESPEGEGGSALTEVKNGEKIDSAGEALQKAEGEKASIDTIAPVKIKDQENTDDSAPAEGENGEAVTVVKGEGNPAPVQSKDLSNEGSRESSSRAIVKEIDSEAAPEPEEKALPDIQQGSASGIENSEVAASLNSDSAGKIANPGDMAGDSKSGISFENVDPKTNLAGSEVSKDAGNPVNEKTVTNPPEIKAEEVSLSKGESGLIPDENEANKTQNLKTVSAEQAKEKENIVPRSVNVINNKEGLAFKHASGQEGTSKPVLTEADQEPLNEQKKLFNGVFMNKKAADPLEKGAEISSVKVEQLREERYRKHFASFANHGESSEGRIELSSAGRASLTNNENFKSVPPIGFQNAEGTAVSDQQAEMNQLLWKDHTAEVFESSDKKGSEQYLNFMRLGQIPISNLSARRDMVSGFAQGVLKAVGGGKATSETWQKHNFVLEDGKNINLSARQNDGVLQLKIGSSHSELGRLLQQYQHEIRQHLEQECGLEVDLQFDQQPDDEMSGFFGESSSSSQQIRKGLAGSGDQQNSEKSANQVLTKTVRKFGYNRMEWTA